MVVLGKALEELTLELALKSPKHELPFEFVFKLKEAPFETPVYGYGDALDEVLECTRQRGVRSERNGPYVCTECAWSACILKGLGKLKTNQRSSTLSSNTKSHGKKKKGHPH